ncbi:MAG TPA: hypothetical protein VM819_13950 [Vicinamibacterales bacterium]|nr:hypothetical protein [Vicinamibacterales bacterium]
MRLVTLLLTVTLIGPSVGALVCDWTCATVHQATAAPESNCHDTPGPAQTATFAAGHACHGLPALAAGIMTCVPPLADTAVAARTPAYGTAMVRAALVTRRPDRSHAPPPTHIVPLRI